MGRNRAVIGLGVAIGTIGLLVMVAVVIYMLSQDTDSATLQINVERQPTRTVLPSPTPFSPTLTPTLDVAANPITLTLQIDVPTEGMPADGRSTATVEVAIEAPARFNLEGQTVYFQVYGGGTMSPANATFVSNHARSTYVAGKSAGVNLVQIVAIVDVPDYGRIRDEVTFNLVRQGIQLEVPCGYVVTTGTSDAPLSFTLHSNLTTESSGQYLVQISLQTPDSGLLRSAPDDTADSDALIIGVLDTPLVVYYTPPSSSQSGTSPLCISLTDRPGDSPVCIPLVWGPAAAALDTNVRPVAYWKDDIWPILQSDAIHEGNYHLNTVALVSYEVMLSTWEKGIPHLNIPDASQAWSPKECLVAELYADTSASIVPPPEDVSWVVRWQVEAPGMANTPVVEHVDSIIAAQELALIRNTDPFVLTDGISTLRYLLGMGDDAFKINAVAPRDYSIPMTAVLLQVYAPAQNADPVNMSLRADTTDGGLLVASTLGGYTYYRQANMLISFAGDSLSVPYIAPEVMTTSLGGQIQEWRAVYLLGSIGTDVVRVVPRIQPTTSSPTSNPTVMVETPTMLAPPVLLSTLVTPTEIPSVTPIPPTPAPSPTETLVIPTSESPPIETPPPEESQ